MRWPATALRPVSTRAAGYPARRWLQALPISRPRRARLLLQGGNRMLRPRLRRPVAPYAVLVCAVMLSGCTVDSPTAAAADPWTASEVVRSYVAAADRGDVASMCRLSLPEDGASVQDCVVNLRAAFEDPGLARTRWREPRVEDVRVDRKGRFLRARVRVRYERPADGTRRGLWDMWWLQRRSGRVVVVKPGRFGARSLGFPAGVADAEWGRRAHPYRPARRSDVRVHARRDPWTQP